MVFFFQYGNPHDSLFPSLSEDIFNKFLEICPFNNKSGFASYSWKSTLKTPHNSTFWMKKMLK